MFFNRNNGVSVMVHGDDFLAVGDKTATESLRKVLTDTYKVKAEVLGGGGGELSEIRVLNRIVRRTDNGITIEADPRNAELMIKDLDLINAKSRKVPGSKEEMKRVADARVKLEDTEDLAALDPGSKPTKSGSQSDELAQTTVEPTTYSKPGLPTSSTKTAASPSGKGRGLHQRQGNRGRRRRRSSDESIDAVDFKDDSALLVGEEARLY